MNVLEIDPTADQRWDNFVQDHLQASIFHTRAWLQTLQQTYGYKPRAVVIARDEGKLIAAIPFCEVTGCFGKRRLVSLPFSDHCQPLFDTQEQLQGLIAYLRAKRDTSRWDYLELRPKELIATTPGLEESERFVFHRLNLRRNPEEIFTGLHNDCVRRKIRRAERSGLTVEHGRTDALLKKFYRLQVITRRRHGLPAQPTEWFRNLAAEFGSKLTVSVASSAGHPIAGIITIRHNHTLVYKYGGSDHRFRSLGGMQLLLWQAIQRAMRDGLTEFDLGRSDVTDAGLVAFKDRWGAEQNFLSYRRYGTMPSTRFAKTYQSSIGKYVWAHTPQAVLTAAGRVLYRQLG